MNTLLIALFARTDIPMFSPNRAKHQHSANVNTMFIAGQYVE